MQNNEPLPPKKRPKFTPKGPGTNPGGRPRKLLDLEQMKKLAAMGCTHKEIAVFFDVCLDTITENYAGVIRDAREVGKSSVRRMMWKHGDKGNSTAMKYLVHNILKERIEDPTVIMKESNENESLKAEKQSLVDSLVQIIKNNES